MAFKLFQKSNSPNNKIISVYYFLLFSFSLFNPYVVLFDDAIKHCCRIARIIKNPGGHALLVGVGGSGKQSLSRLSSFICGFTVYQITINQTYSMNDLKEDLQKMYTRAGVKDEGISFLFTDSQVKDERFLVYLNDLLSSGNIPDLFDTEGVDNIVGSMTGAVKAAGLKPDNNVCWEFFMDRVRGKYSSEGASIA